MSLAAQLDIIPAASIARIKGDRRYLELALDLGGRWLNRQIALEGDGCRCPFHHDLNPSGSLHLDRSWNGQKKCARTWVYTCHGCPDRGGEWNDLNPDKRSNSGDGISVLLVAAKRAGQPMSFQQACRRLLDEFERRFGPSSGPTSQPPAPGPTPAQLAEAEQEALEAHERLLSDEGLVERLWSERAIDRATIERFKLGFLVDRGRQWWLIPIRSDDGRFMVQKRHAADGQQPKSMWWPAGAKRGDPLLYAEQSGDGLLWHCPGELKCMAVASLGLEAVAITCGEKPSGLSPEALSRTRQLAGHRPVAIPQDNDDKGRRYAGAAASQLAKGGLDARAVDLPLTAKGADVTDWLLERRVHKGLDAATVAAQLQDAFDRSLAPTPVPQGDEPSADIPESTAADSSVAPDDGDDDGDRHRDSQQVAETVDVPIRSIGDVLASPDTWKPKERISTHIRSLDEALGGGFTTAGLHMAVGKPGSCKTQLATQLLLNIAGRGTPVGFVSLEMEAAEVGRLAVCQLAGVPRSAVERGLKRLSDKAAAESIRQAISTHHNMPLYVVDGAAYDYACNRDQLDRLIEAGVQRHGWRFVVLDHLGELTPTDTDRTRETVQVERSNIAALRAIAKRHNVALLVVAQMRKAATYKDVKKAKFTLDDVLGAAEIGYKLDTCIGVVKEYAHPPRCSRLLVSLLKTRWSAPIDVPVHLKWLPSSGCVCDLSEPSDESATVDTAGNDEKDK